MTEPCLLMKNIRYSYGDIEVLRGVDFDLYPGEIHALVGERMSGKSTLARILSGDLKKQVGTILINGKEINSLTLRSAVTHKIGIIYQDLHVFPALNLVENVFAGRNNQFFLSNKEKHFMENECIKILKLFDLNIDIHTPINRLSEANQQIVELLRLFSCDLDILILDEISHRRTPEQMTVIFKILNHLRVLNKAIIYITADFEEIFQLADRVTILKNGYRKGTEKVSNLDRIRLFSLAYSFALNKEDTTQSAQSLALNRFDEELIQTLPTGTLLLDQQENILFINTAVANLIKETQDFRNHTFSDFLDSLGVQEKEKVLDTVKARKNQIWEKLVTTSGAILRVKTSALWDDKVFQGTILFMDDVSIDVQLKEYLSRADQMASIAELAAGVAHEINNPLAIIQNYLVLSRITKNSDELQENITMMEKELQRIVEIVQNLISFSRVNQFPKKRMNLCKVVDEVLILLSHKLRGKDIHIEKKWPQDPIILPLIENKIKQVFINLIVNAYEAVLQHGNIRIEATQDLKTNHAEILITDDGYGIPPEIQSKIFLPFYTTKISKNNTGLGLSICQHMVELHGGILLFESIPGKTTFIIRLPLN